VSVYDRAIVESNHLTVCLPTDGESATATFSTLLIVKVCILAVFEFFFNIEFVSYFH
jgi:hypothetical protein